MPMLLESSCRPSSLRSCTPASRARQNNGRSTYTTGAAGWILGAGCNLLRSDHAEVARPVFLCASGVLLIGGILWSLWLAGRRLHLFALIQMLPGASVVLGMAAIWIMRARGVVRFAVDPSGDYPVLTSVWVPRRCIFAYNAYCWEPSPTHDPYRRRP